MTSKKIASLIVGLLLLLQVGVVALSQNQALAQSTISIRLRSDTSDDNYSLGSIRFDGISYSLPATIQKEVGNYRAEGFPPAGYSFKEWQPIGSNIFIDSRSLTSQSVIVSVTSGGSVILEMELIPSPPPPPPPPPPPETISIRLRSDTSDDNFGLGSIKFDGVTYTLPTTIEKEAQNYRAEAFPPDGYMFKEWQGIGSNILVMDPTLPSTIVSITNGDSVILEMELIPTPPPTVSIRLRSDTSDDNFGLGSIRFDGTSYSLPITIERVPGNYRVEALPPADYEFTEWQPIGSNILIDSAASLSAIVSISSGDSVILEMELEPTPPPPPPGIVELLPTEVYFEGGIRNIGMVQDFYCLVENRGEENSDEFYVDFFVDGNFAERVGPDDVLLDSREKFETDRAWTVVEGTHTVRCVVDSTGTVSEPDERNNEKSYTFVVGPGKIQPEVTIAISPLES
ncbi:MAG: CARDB domain-containing protein [Nitrososphaera sp.]